MDELVIRPARPSDLPDLRQAVVELQDYERRLHATRLPGEQIADAYVRWLQQQAEKSGIVLVAEIDGSFAGFAAGWIVQADHIAESAEANRYGYLSDICVMPAYRGQRIAHQLARGDRAASGPLRDCAFAPCHSGRKCVSARELSERRVCALRDHL